MDNDQKTISAHERRQLQSFYENQVNCDVSLIVTYYDKDTRQLKCNRCILAEKSDYFRALFKYNEADLITVKDFPCAVVVDLVEYLYYNKIDINPENVLLLLEAALYLQINEVISLTKKFIHKNLNISSCISVYEFCSRINVYDIAYNAEQLIKDEFQDIMNNAAFLETDVDFLSKFIGSSQIIIDSKSLLFDAILDWIKMNPEARKQFTFKLLSLIKLPLMSPQDLEEKLHNSTVNCDLKITQLIKESIKYLKDGKLLTDQKILDEYHLQTRVVNVLCCIGGCDGKNKMINSVENSNDGGRIWLSGNDLPKERYYFGATESQGKIFVVGGMEIRGFLSSVLMFDLSVNKWRTLPSLPEPRRGLDITCVGNRLYACGGRAGSVVRRVTRTGTKAETTKTVFAHEFTSSDHWTSVEPMINKRWDHITCTLNHLIYCIGGQYGNSPLSACERFDPDLNVWTSISSLTHERYRFAGAVHKGHIYVAGGVDLSNAALSSVERYSPNTDQWEQLSESLNVARFFLGMTSCGNKLYVTGGLNNLGGKSLDVTEEYDFDSKKWSYVGRIKIGRRSHALVTFKQ